MWPVFPEAAGNAAGKYLPKVRVLDGRSLDGHLAKDRLDPYNTQDGTGDHHGVDVEGVHYHAPETAKYVLLGRRGTTGRIDLHPMALDLLPDADRVFFVLEGALKNDAVLSAGEAVFSVPSITLWNPKELQWFAETFLLGKVVYVVPDADWVKNPAVDRQALYVRETIRSAGLRAHIAAPPTDRLHEGVKGVDDYLGFGAGSLEGLIVRGREAPEPVLSWAMAQPWSSTALRVLTGLSLHGGTDGVVSVPMDTLMRMTGVPKKERLPGVLERYASAYDIEGSLDTATRTYRNTQTGGTVKITDWVQRPTITVRPEYRATENATTLADHKP
jgi:hypothetical protein